MGLQKNEVRGTTPLDIKNMNDNFTQLWFDTYGNGKFAQKLKVAIDALLARATDAEGNLSTIAQTATDVRFDFDNMKIGGRNYLLDTVGAFASLSTDYNYGKTYVIPMDELAGKEVTMSFEGKVATAGAICRCYIFKTDWSWKQTMDVTTNYYSKASLTFTFPNDTTGVYQVAFFNYPQSNGGSVQYKKPKLEIGNKVTDWSPKEGEFIATTHIFNSEGYTLKDVNGASLITANGVANEQNFSSTQNVESGYPLNFSFRIGDTTSLITSVLIRIKQYNFRTDSKGAASGGGVKSSANGGGSTSGASSKSTADMGLTAGKMTETPYGGVVSDAHRHVIAANQLEHSHGMAHTHWTNDHAHTTDISHAHTVEFGILETPNVNGSVWLAVDNVQRVGSTNTDVTFDATTWVTTNGVHNISLTVSHLKRIQCDVFIKSYIRR